MYGEVKVEEKIWETKQTSRVRVLPEYIGISARGYTRKLKRIMTDFGAEESFEMAHKRIKEHYGIEKPTSSIRVVTLKEAKKIEAEEERKPMVKTLSGEGKKLIITEADGSQIRMVKTGTKAGDKRKGIEIYWSEAKLAVSCADGSLGKRYAVTFKGPTEAGEKWAKITKEVGWGTKSKIHSVGDGSLWIVNQSRIQFGNQGTFLLDFYHASEHLWKVAEECLDGDRRWFEKQKQNLKEGKIDAVLESLKKLSKPDNIAEKTYNYFDSRREQLFYKQALEADLPIGSGMIEGAHKYVLQKRLKRSGTRWLESNAKAMSSLLVLRANNEWGEHWDALGQAA